MAQSSFAEDRDAPAGAPASEVGLLRRLHGRRPPMRSVGHDPDYRFSLANERTFLAWIRTALALLAGGVAAVQLVPAFKFPGGRLTLGVILVLLSLAVATGSYFRWMANERAMRLDRPLQHSLIPRLLAAGLTVVALLALLMVIVSG